MERLVIIVAFTFGLRVSSGLKVRVHFVLYKGRGDPGGVFEFAHFYSFTNRSAQMLEDLHEDCWRLVLSYVPVNDILRAEAVSRQWQLIILQYIRGTRIRIEPVFHLYEPTRGSDCRIFKLREDHEKTVTLFEEVTKKLGPPVVATYCYNKTMWSTLTRNCPNLEHLALFGLGQHDLWLTDQIADCVNYGRLKQISFKYFLNITDDSVSKFLESDILEELVIFSSKNVTGRCLNSLKSTSLRSLSLIACKNSKLQYLLLSLGSLTELVKLELDCVAPEIFQNVDLLLNEMPYLEELVLHLEENVVFNDDVAVSIGRLSGLKRLELCSSAVNDDWLKEVARGCRQLKVLELKGCSVSVPAVVALCRAIGPPLKNLRVEGVDGINGNHDIACIGYCPKLKVKVP